VGTLWDRWGRLIFQLVSSLSLYVPTYLSLEVERERSSRWI
jgi:hypothetical protein